MNVIFREPRRPSPGSDREAAELVFGGYILPSTTMELTLMSIEGTGEPEEVVCVSMHQCSVSVGSELVTVGGATGDDGLSVTGPG